MTTEPPDTASASSLYDRVGGDAYFVALVQRFYVRVESDAVLRPLYPANLEPGKANLAAFLVQMAVHEIAVAMLMRVSEHGVLHDDQSSRRPRSAAAIRGSLAAPALNAFLGGDAGDD